MKIKQLANTRNLELAWRRITTGGNHQYKRLYRDLYHAYEVALEANLRDIRQRLLGGAFVPQRPERMYVPKASGLHRPVTLLSIEDQIVLQAFANLAAERIQPHRAKTQFKVVFSNILQKQNSIFFFRRWQETYRKFQDRIETQYASGRRWVGDFDLAAFYDTISHELLLRTIYPRTTNDDLVWFEGCLRTWSSDKVSSGHGHGLPQGPLASDFLAECFLLPIDLAMRSCRGYVRYVDDVRLFGKTEDEVRAHLIELERYCRERGLIPQTGKFAIKRAETVEDAMGMLPSIADPHHTAGPGTLTAAEARESLATAIGGRPLRVIDKTRLRFVLYRARPDARLVGLVLRLLPHHPEHTDAFFSFIGRCGYRKSIERTCLNLISHSPYPYVRGEAWHVLARYRSNDRATVFRKPRALTTKAVDIAKKKTLDNFAERWGVCHFLCASERMTSARFSRFAKFQAPLLQSLLAPVLPSAAFSKNEAVEFYLRRSDPEPGLSVCSSIHERGLAIADFGLTETDLPSQVSNTLRELGVLSAPPTNIDPIGEILSARYGVSRNSSWHRLLGAEYVHALGLLKQAEAAFAVGPSFWLTAQNAFNQTIFLAIQRHFAATNHPAKCTTVNKIGQLVDFGVTLETNGPFSANCPIVGSCFREVNTRRNRLPSSHPYEKKTATQSQYLKPAEKRRLVTGLRDAYATFVLFMP